MPVAPAERKAASAAGASRSPPSASMARAKRSRVMAEIAFDASTGWPKKGSLLSRSSMPRPAVKVAKSTVTSNMIGTKASQDHGALPPVTIG